MEIIFNCQKYLIYIKKVSKDDENNNDIIFNRIGKTNLLFSTVFAKKDIWYSIK